MQRPSHVARLVAAGLRDSAMGAASVETGLAGAALGDDSLMGNEYEAWGLWVPQRHRLVMSARRVVMDMG
jgi:hypothetical protein